MPKSKRAQQAESILALDQFFVRQRIKIGQDLNEHHRRLMDRLGRLAEKVSGDELHVTTRGTAGGGPSNVRPTAADEE